MNRIGSAAQALRAGLHPIERRKKRRDERLKGEPYGSVLAHSFWECNPALLLQNLQAAVRLTDRDEGYGLGHAALESAGYKLVHRHPLGFVRLGDHVDVMTCPSHDSGHNACFMIICGPRLAAHVLAEHVPIDL